MRLGFIVNPVAGMGGRVGLKGTDGVIEEAIKRGAKPLSPSRAIEFLEALKRSLEGGGRLSEIVTCRGLMGENEIKEARLEALEVLPIPSVETRGENPPLKGGASSLRITTAADTKASVRLFVARRVDLLVFVGGDGTARDVMDAFRELGSEAGEVGDTLDAHSFSLPPVLGVPSGVKMYSGVFALNPVSAAEIVALYAEGKAKVSDLEVMDIDEEAFRSDRLAIRLYGYMKCLYVPMMSQAGKELSPDMLDEKENQMAIARTIIENMDPNGLYILGPGTTVKCLADLLNVGKTTLGVDVYHKGRTIAIDANEDTILAVLQKHGGHSDSWIVVSPIGRQGVIFGRGNQQISPNVIKQVGKDHIVVMATKSKVRDLDGGCLRVDTGDTEVDDMLEGYVKVTTDYREWRMVQVSTFRKFE